MGKEVFTAEIRINALVKEAQNDLSNFEKDLQKTWKYSEPPKSVSKSYEALRNRLMSLQEIAKKGTVNSSDVQQANEDYRALKKGIRNLAIEFKLMSAEQKKALLAPEEQQAMKARASAIKEYTDAIKKNRQIQSERKSWEEKLAKNENVQKQNKAKLEGLKTRQTNLEKGSPTMSQQAKDYASNLAKAKELEAEIEALKKNRQKAYVNAASGSGKLSVFDERIQKAQQERDGLDLTSGKQAFEEYEKIQKDYITNLENVKKQIADTSEEIDNLDKENKKINDTLNGKLKLIGEDKALDSLKDKLKELGVSGIENAKDIDTIRAVIKKLDQSKLDSVTKEINDLIGGLEGADKDLEGIREEIDRVNSSIKEQDEADRSKTAFQERIKQCLGYAGAAQVLRRSLNNAMETIKELDAIMTEMSVVTDLTVGDYWDQLSEYSARASELGVSIGDAYQAATLYYQQGLKTNEVNAISVETLKMAKIANMDAAEATNKMTAALRGFNMELNEDSARRISDVYSKLAAITAADTREIANAMTKTASIASSAGMEFETTAAFLSQIIETTRESAETAGTAMKTIVARFQELKKDPAEIELVDGESVNANQIEKALRSVGVALRDSSGQFRELDEVFIELSKKWDGLDKNTQRYIATIAAGSRQQSRFIAMMSDYERTAELVAAANSSTGASQEQFEKTLDGVEAKFEQLKNAWDTFTMGILNSDFVKLGIDLLTKFLTVINNVTEGIGGFGSSISKIGAVLMVFKLGKSLFEKIKEPISKFFIDIIKEATQAGKDATKGYVEGIEGEAKAQAQTKKDKSQSLQTGQKIEETRDTIATSEMRGVGGFIGNAGIKVMNAVGVGSFVSAHDSFGKVKSIKDSKEGKKYLAARQKASDANKAKRKAEKNYNKVSKKGTAEERKEAQKALKAADKDQKKANKNLEKYGEIQDEINKESKKGWDSIAHGIQQVSTSLIAGGIAVGMLGQAFKDAGAEEFGETLEQVGSIMTFCGTILGVLVPLINLLKPAFKKAGDAGVKSGTKTTAAWGAVGIIVMAVMAAILIAVVAVLAVMNVIQKNSPEAKLEATKEAANEAAKAAEAAATSYNDLKKSIESLEEQQTTIENLAYGTEQWKEAVEALNSSVLELIENYPELAQFVSGSGGILQLDLNDPNVKQVIQDYKMRAASARVTQFAANASVETASQEAIRSHLSEELKIDGSFVQTEALAKALLQGAIQVGQNELGEKTYVVNNEEVAKSLGLDTSRVEEFYTALGESTDELYGFAQAMTSSDGKMDSYYRVAIQSIVTNLDSSEVSEKDLNEISTLISPDVFERKYAEYSTILSNTDYTKDSGLSDSQKKEKQDAIEKEYGQGATIKDNKVTKANGETFDLTDAQIKTIIAGQKTAADISTLAYLAKGASIDIKKEFATYNGNDENAISAMNKIISGNTDFSSLEREILNGLTREDWENLYEKLGYETKAIYGSMDNFTNQMVSSISLGVTDYDTAIQKLSKTLGKTDLGDIINDKWTASSLKNLNQKIESMSQKSGEAVIEVYKAFLDSFELNEEQQAQMASIILSTDWSSKEAITGMQIELQQTFGLTITQTQSLADSLAKLAGASSAFAVEVKTYGKLYEINTKLNDSLARTTALQWEYNRALEKGHDNLSENLEKIINEYRLQSEALENKPTAIAEQMGAIYASGITRAEKAGFAPDKYDFTEYFRLGLTDLEPEKEEMTIQRYYDFLKSEDPSGKLVGAFDSWKQELAEKYGELTETEEDTRNLIDSIDSLINDLRENYRGLKETITSTLQNSQEKYLEQESQNNQDIINAISDLISSIQEQIEEQRQERENEKTEESLKDLASKLSYLSMDTSGSKLLQLQETEKALEEQREAYVGSLIDQTLDQMSKDSQKAAGQRERQIEIAQQQLEAFWKTEIFTQQVENALDVLLKSGSSSSIYQQVLEAQTDGLTAWEKSDWMQEFDRNINQGITYLENVDSLSGLLTEVIGYSAIGDEWREFQLKAKEVADAKKFEIEVEKKLNDTKDEGYTASIFTHTAGTESSIQDQSNKLDAAAEFMKAEQYSTTDAYATSNDKLKWFNENADMQFAQAEKRFNPEMSNEEKISGYVDELNPAWEKYGEERTQKRNNIIQQAVQEAKDRNRGLYDFGRTGTYQNLLSQYKDQGGQEGVFKKAIEDQIEQDNFIFTNGYVPHAYYRWYATPGYVDEDFIYQNEVGGKVNMDINAGGAQKIDYINNNFKYAQGESVVLYNGELYGNTGSTWKPLNVSDTSKIQHLLRKFKTGGLASFTGPAWLDGTKSRPEYVLSADQTKRFFSLVDVLESLDKKGTVNNNNSTSQTNEISIDLDINVEQISSDYDVEQMANKIRSMLYEDSMYRNVNNINLIR